MSSAHRGSGLREDPAVPLEIGGDVDGGARVGMDLLHDRRTAILGAVEVRLEIVDVDPRHVRAGIRRALRVQLEDVQDRVAEPELDPRKAMLALGQRIRASGRSLAGSNPKTSASQRAAAAGLA
jgi:hypothetical protein